MLDGAWIYHSSTALGRRAARAGTSKHLVRTYAQVNDTIANWTTRPASAKAGSIPPSPTKYQLDNTFRSTCSAKIFRFSTGSTGHFTSPIKHPNELTDDSEQTGHGHFNRRRIISPNRIAPALLRRRRLISANRTGESCADIPRRRGAVLASDAMEFGIRRHAVTGSQSQGAVARNRMCSGDPPQHDFNGRFQRYGR